MPKKEKSQTKNSRPRGGKKEDGHGKAASSKEREPRSNFPRYKERDFSPWEREEVRY